MTYEEVLAATPTESENVSIGMFNEILTCGWRLYEPITTTDFLDLRSRFLRAHARTPGLATPETLATEPAVVIAFSTDDTAVTPAPRVTYHGGIFVNGAVIHIHTEVGDQELLLVDDDTAELWCYPESYFRLAPPA